MIAAPAHLTRTMRLTPSQELGTKSRRSLLSLSILFVLIFILLIYVLIGLRVLVLGTDVFRPDIIRILRKRPGKRR